MNKKQIIMWREIADLVMRPDSICSKKICHPFAIQVINQVEESVQTKIITSIHDKIFDPIYQIKRSIGVNGMNSRR